MEHARVKLSRIVYFSRLFLLQQGIFVEIQAFFGVELSKSGYSAHKVHVAPNPHGAGFIPEYNWLVGE